MDKKKILFVLPSLEIGGAEYQTIEMCNALQHEYDVYLIILSNKGPLFENIHLPKTNIFILESPFYVITFRNMTIKTFFTTIHTISTVIKQNEVTTVIANLPIAHFLLRLSKSIFFLNHFQLLNVHHSQQFRAREQGLGKKIFNKFNNALSLMADNINIFVSKASLEDSIAHFFYKKSTIKVIYNGIKELNFISSSNPFLALGSKDDAYRIVLAGRLVKEKGHLFFLEILNSLLKRGEIEKTIEVYIIGEGPLFDNISEYIRENNLTYVYLLGKKKKDDLPLYFSSANLVVIPSVAEGFGLIALEAIFSGATVLSSDAGGLAEIITPNVNGFQFRSNNARSLENKIVNIINKNIEIDKEVAIAHTQKYFSFTQMLEAYKRVINANK
jgi:glycosyltransferase involved in cell wall biosynthesis